MIVSAAKNVDSCCFEFLKDSRYTVIASTYQQPDIMTYVLFSICYPDVSDQLEVTDD